MMSDLAEGSTAVRQLQQNVAAAPYVGDLTKAASERKIQEDRLAAQYAPQEAAMKIAQEEQTLQQTKLANLVGQAKIDMTAEKKAAITKLTADPEYAKLSPEDQSRKLASAVMGIDTADGERFIKIADSEQAKGYINKLKEHEVNRQNIADGLATVRGATDEQFAGLIQKMPEDMKKAIKMHIPGFFEERDPKLQRAQLEALMNNGEGKNNMAANEQRLKLLEKQNEVAELRARIVEQQFENIRAKGVGKTSDAESKTELREYAQSRRDAARIDSDFKKPLQEAETAWKKAAEKDKEKVGILSSFGGGTSAIDQAKAAAAKGDTKKLEELPSTKAWRELQELKKEVVDKKLSALENMPEGKEKDRIYNALMNEMDKIDTTSYGPTAKATPKDSPAPDASGAKGAAAPSAAPASAVAAPVVPSNKGAVGTQAAPIPFEPGKTIPENGKYYINNNKQIAMWDESKKKMVAGEPAPTSKPAEPAVATTPAEPVMTDAEKQAKAAKNREKNLSLPVDKPKPTAAPAAKNTSTDFTGAKSADLIEPGNIDLTKRPVVKNKDGSISTVRSMSFEEDGMQILIPTVVGNKVVSDKTAIDHYHKTGEHLGMFSSVKAANAYAKKLHEEQDKMYSGKKQESIEDIERDLARLKRENAATDKRIEKLKKQNASKSKVDDEKESQKEVERQIERLKKLAEGG